MEEFDLISKKMWMSLSYCNSCVHKCINCLFGSVKVIQGQRKRRKVTLVNVYIHIVLKFITCLIEQDSQWFASRLFLEACSHHIMCECDLFLLLIGCKAAENAQCEHLH